MTQLLTTEQPAPLIEAGQLYVRNAVATVESVDLEQGLVDVKLVPYEVEADLGGGWHEVFSRGAMAGALGNPSRCKVTNQQHQRDTVVGQAVSLRDEPDGLWGTLKIEPTSDGKDLLILLRAKVLEQMSPEFRALKGGFEHVRRGPGDVLVRHTRAELVGISPVSEGAYGEDARVIAVRSAEQALLEGQRNAAREAARAWAATLTAGVRKV